MRTPLLSLTALLPLISNLTSAIPLEDNKPSEHQRLEHIVLVKRNWKTTGNVENVLRRVNLHPKHADVKHVFNNAAFVGFAANIDKHTAETLGLMDDVDTVEESSVVSVSGVETGTTWGLHRISSGENMTDATMKQTNFTYAFNDNDLGAGTDIYMVDTGIRTTHELFQGRAVNGFTAFKDFDDNIGHGTHTSGTAGAHILGVAQLSNKISVKILDGKVGGEGSGTTTDYLRGLEYIVNQHERRKADPNFVASIASMSIGFGSGGTGPVAAVDNAAQAAVARGIHVVVAAGNDGSDACKYSPARSGGTTSAVITVGSIGAAGDVSSFSNWGKCVDIFGPGESVLSCSRASDTATEFMKGTSMATPHVSGLVAYLARTYTSLAQNPAAMKQTILAAANWAVSPDKVPVAFNLAGVAGLPLPIQHA